MKLRIEGRAGTALGSVSKGNARAATDARRRTQVAPGSGPSSAGEGRGYPEELSGMWLRAIKRRAEEFPKRLAGGAGGRPELEFLLASAAGDLIGSAPCRGGKRCSALRVSGT